MTSPNYTNAAPASAILLREEARAASIKILSIKCPDVSDKSRAIANAVKGGWKSPDGMEIARARVQQLFGHFGFDESRALIIIRLLEQ